jgi:hypothetical protein
MFNELHTRKLDNTFCPQELPKFSVLNTFPPTGSHKGKE